MPGSSISDRVLVVERRGVEAVPLQERHGRPVGQFVLWLGANFIRLHWIPVIPELGFWVAVGISALIGARSGIRGGMEGIADRIQSVGTIPFGTKTELENNR